MYKHHPVTTLYYCIWHCNTYSVSLSQHYYAQASCCNKTVLLYLTLQYTCSLAKLTTVYRHHPMTALHLRLRERTRLYSHHAFHQLYANRQAIEQGQTAAQHAAAAFWQSHDCCCCQTENGQRKEQKHGLLILQHAIRLYIECGVQPFQNSETLSCGMRQRCLMTVKLTCSERFVLEKPPWRGRTLRPQKEAFAAYPLHMECPTCRQEQNRRYCALWRGEKRTDQPENEEWFADQVAQCVVCCIMSHLGKLSWKGGRSDAVQQRLFFGCAARIAEFKACWRQHVRFIQQARRTQEILRDRTGTQSRKGERRWRLAKPTSNKNKGR